jgi:hypothetical protein
VTPLIESGRVFLPQAAGWLSEFLDELAAFPNAAHDDHVNFLTQGLNYFRTHEHPLFAYWREKGGAIEKAKLDPGQAQIKSAQDREHSGRKSDWRYSRRIRKQSAHPSLKRAPRLATRYSLAMRLL